MGSGGGASRRKGHNFERAEVTNLNEQLYLNNIKINGEAVKVKRNLEQYQSNNLSDILLPGFAIECKRYKKNNSDQPKSAWWDQVCEACGDDVPLLIYKYDYQDVMCMFPALLFSFDDNGFHFKDQFKTYPATMEREAFMQIFMPVLKAIYG